jgi:spermidine synthase
MAAVYRRGQRSPRVRVERGRRGRSLRIDGTFASWYAPGESLAGPVWNALVAPLLLLPPERRRTLLVLGLGGGSAARVARALAPAAHIVGVELDAEVVRAAREWFDLDALRIEVVQADARAYLRSARRRFDAVIEDVFTGTGRAVRKPDWLPRPGLALARRRVAPRGILVVNALDEAASVSREIRRLYAGALRIDVDGYDNRIFVGGPASLCARRLRRRLRADPLFADAAPDLSLRTLR